MEILGAPAWAVISGLAAWAGTAWVYREKRTNDIAAALEKREKENAAAADRMEEHRDDLTFQLLQTARNEVGVAYTEMKDLREEVKTLRALELHFFHFQQALDHLEAILFASTPELKVAAERTAKAFLNRMRRLQEAKGTLRNEAQAAVSEIHMETGLEPHVIVKRDDEQ